MRSEKPLSSAAIALLLMLAGCEDAAQSVPKEPAATSAPSREEVLQAQGPEPTYIGSHHCAECHSEEQALWQGSHHDLAMQRATEATVRGDFGGTQFEYNGVTSTFFRQGEQFWVRTDGPEGELQEYPISYVFGVQPLQQYLIDFPDGRKQVLSIAWDTRPASAGGQRWFHLYSEQAVDHNHPLHWTARSQNWNHMCAECHSTNLKKNYRFAQNRFETTWSEIDVACEACHGPGSRHVAWANNGADGDVDKALVVRFAAQADWHFANGAATAQRSVPRSDDKELNVCARCHSRRGLISEDYLHGGPLGDTHRLALLTPDLYHSDGQPADETFVHGSFLQSKMYHRGVTCTDCHNPHSLKLRAPGDQVCAQCHRPDHFATKEHHFHPPDSAGARCVKCHMPATDFMVVDTRHDHSFRIPRPDLSVSLGVPNTCNQCHEDRDAQWAVATMQRWYGGAPKGFQDYATLLAQARTGDPAAYAPLLELAQDESQPAIARATAATHLGDFLDQQSAQVLVALLQTDEPLLRRAAADAFSAAPRAFRAQALAPLLLDDVRDVRQAAIRALAGTGLMAAGTADDPIGDARREFIASQRLNADRPEAHLNLGNFYAQEQAASAAETAYRNALELAPDFPAATVNLADLYRALGREQDAGTLLKEALARSPDDASLNHSYGLWLVRQQQLEESLAYLQRAMRSAPEVPTYGYVYAIAQQGAGRREAAIQTLQKVLEASPYHRRTLQALHSLYVEQGEAGKAKTIARRLMAFPPPRP